MLYRTTTAPVFSLRREIDRLFEDTFGPNGERRGWMPAVDVREDDKELVFEVELPGVSAEQVEITADNGLLTIRGERRQRQEKEGQERRFHVVERSYGVFSRTFQLPQGLDDQNIGADFANGVLTVRVPKAQRPQPRKIRIGQGADEAQRIEGTAQERNGAGAATAAGEEGRETAHAGNGGNGGGGARTARARA